MIYRYLFVFLLLAGQLSFARAQSPAEKIPVIILTNPREEYKPEILALIFEDQSASLNFDQIRNRLSEFKTQSLRKNKSWPVFIGNMVRV